jgi:hypothetical protein
LRGFATEKKKRAVRRLGEVMDENRQGTKGSKVKGARVDDRPALESQGVDKHLADAARTAAAMPAEKFEASVEKAKKIAVDSVEGTEARERARSR